MDARMSRPDYRPEPESAVSETGDLFALVRVVDEQSLGRRLLQHGYDLYAGAPYADYAERLAACILRNGAQRVISGRGPKGRPETYQQAFERVCGKSLPKPKAAKTGER